MSICSHPARRRVAVGAFMLMAVCADHTRAQQASSVTQHGITWTFAQPAQVGQFVNGDYWVIGPVDIISIDPPSITSEGRTINGSMVNPMAGTEAHGYDSSAYGQYNGGQYSHGLNVALGVSPSDPLTLGGPGIKSLVSTISRSQAAVDPQIRTAAVLTVLESAPPADAFRPPYAGSAKAVAYSRSQVDTSLLQNVPPVPSTPSMSSIVSRFTRPWIDHAPGWMGSFLHPSDNMSSYARDISNDVSKAALMLHLDLPLAQKEDLLRGFIQVGIDLKGVADNNGENNWIGMAGHGSGRKWPILFSGMLLGDLTMMAMTQPGSGIRFSEDGQTFIVENLPGGINGGHGGYTSSHLGMPEWGTQHDNAPHLDDVTWYAPGTNVAYRVCCTAGAWVGTVLAAHITPGGIAAWNHPPYFMYQDRYMATQGGAYRSLSDFTEEMWDTYRSVFGPVSPNTAGGTVSEPPPVAAFNATTTTGPAPLSTEFSDQSTGSVTEWAWSFGDGNSATGQNASHTYVTAGTYDVTLTVTGPGGSDTITQSACVTVSEPEPGASISCTTTAGFAPLTVAFSDTSTGTITAWAWSFGDGATSSLENPTHTYGSPGSYTVSLTVSGPNGSSTVVHPDHIVVSEPAPVAGFSAASTLGTSPLNVSFTDASTGAVSVWTWDFGDGNSSNLQHPSHSYASVGTYDVCLTVSGPGGSHSLTQAALVTVIEPEPVASFSGSPTSGTAPLAVSFSDESTGAVTSWSWSFGDGGISTLENPVHTYSVPGTYAVTLTVAGPGGAGSIVQQGYVTVLAQAPVADFIGAPSSGLAPLVVSFTDLSSGSITSRSWDFGDGATSTAQNPSHTYSVPGSYTVSLSVAGPGGSNTRTRSGYVTVTEAAPVAGLSASPASGTAPLTVNFSDQSLGSITSWNWDFGDSASSTSQNPSHTYLAPGSYSVSLTVTGPGGSDTVTMAGHITVMAAEPEAAFSASPTSGTAPLQVTFSDLSSGSIASWAWDFGDGATSSGQNPVHTYTASGTFSVSLTVSGPGGADTRTMHELITVSDVAAGSELIYVTFTNPTHVPGVGRVHDEDVVRYDLQSGTWMQFFDGSDVGLSGTGISAFSILPSGQIAMSFDSASFDLPGLSGGPQGSTVKQSDVVLFTPTSTGSNTQGTFTFYFDGSDVSLTSRGEAIDGLHLLPSGDILISTIGNPSVDGVSSTRDEDVLRFTPSSLGSNTSGTWSLEFDASDLGLTSGSADLTGIAMDGAGQLLFTTKGATTAGGITFADEDIVRFTGLLGSSTSGLLAIYADLSLAGIESSENVNGIHVQSETSGP